MAEMIRAFGVGHNDTSILLEHPILMSVVAFLVFGLALAWKFSPVVDPAEPPVVSHPIPFFGHLIGIMVYGMKYFVTIGEKSKHPIFTLPILNSKVYVVTSPDLVLACQKDTKALSFNPFIVEVFRRMTGLTDEDMAKTKHNMDSKTVTNYMGDMHRVEYASLAPGPALDKMNETVLNNMLSFLQDMPDEPQKIDLFSTARRIVTFSSVRALFGPNNPFDLEPGIYDDFWRFESDLKWLLLDVCPSLTVRKAHQARLRLIESFHDFYKANRQHEASLVVQERLKVALQHGQRIPIIAAFDVGILFGLLANAIPTAFWMLAHIYASPELLAQIRAETAPLIQSTGPDSAVLAIPPDAQFRRACPLITSVFHETLRHISSSLSSGRYVLSDTIIHPSPSPSNPDPKPFLLRAGSTVQIPASGLHYSTDPSSPFNPSPRSFDPARFQTLNLPDPERTINGTFRCFGGGTTLCPGRKFAYMELVGFVTLFINLFDTLDLHDVPAKEEMKIALALAKPVGDELKCTIKRRDIWRGKKVSVTVGAGSGKSVE